MPKGPLDILVNNAGVTHRAPLEDFPEEAWHRILRTNLDGVFHVSKAVARRMIPRGRGKIINVCSVQSESGRPSITPYATTKGGVKMMTKGMCAERARHGIQVNGLAPGYFETELTRGLVDDPALSDWLRRRTPAGRWGKVEELGGAAVFLAAPASDFVNGHILYVDGGMTAVVCPAARRRAAGQPGSCPWAPWRCGSARRPRRRRAWPAGTAGWAAPRG